MCGRYGESKILAQVKDKFPFFRADSALKPRYNIAPTQMAPVIVHQDELVLERIPRQRHSIPRSGGLKGLALLAFARVIGMEQRTEPC